MKLPKARFSALLAFYKSVHGGNVPKTIFDDYLMRLLIDLGEVYDDNEYHLRKATKNTRPHRKLIARERLLNNMSIHIRKLLNMYLSDVELENGGKNEAIDNLPK